MYFIIRSFDINIYKEMNMFLIIIVTIYVYHRNFINKIRIIMYNHIVEKLDVIVKKPLIFMILKYSYVKSVVI